MTQANTAATRATNRAALANGLAASNLAPDLVKAMLGLNIAAADVPARIDRAKRIADLCAAADLRECAAGYVSRGIGLEQVRAELTGAQSAKNVVSARHRQANTLSGQPPSQDVYSRRADQVRAALDNPPRTHNL